MNQINSIDPIKQNAAASSIQKKSPVGKNQPSFKSTLADFMKDVNAMQNKADVSIEKMATGEITDVHQVMNSVQEANVAFNMMMEIRGKVMDAYKEVMRMRL